MSGHGTVLEITVPRRDGKLGIGLNQANRVTDLGPTEKDGLKMWDMIVSVDDVSCGSRTMAEVMADMPKKDKHVLTVLRLDAAPPSSKTTTTSEMEGWLQKQSPAFPNPWQNRKCQLKDGRLWYFANDDASQPKSIALSDVTAISVADLGRGEFKMVATGRTYMFRAPNKASLFSWVKALQLAQMKVRRRPCRMHTHVAHPMCPGCATTQPCL